MRRVVRLLDPPEPVALTPRQLAQRAYRQSAKGREAQARAKAKQMAKPEWKVQKREWSRRWREANPVKNRVYTRIYMRRWRRERAQVDSSPK